VLYFFRTPPGVRVGRAAIDEEAIRLLEQNNPDIEFDWQRILSLPGSAGSSGSGGSRGSGSKGSEGSGFAGSHDRRERREHRERRPAPATEHVESKAAEYAEHAEPEPLEPESLEPEPVEPLDLPEPLEPEAPRYARLGAAGLVRLRARYAEVLARITEKPLDEAQREELRGKAERLNPDAWVTEDEVSAALEQYETVFEELRAVVGRHQSRRRRRRRD
jgi:hypothetical protein